MDDEQHLTWNVWFTFALVFGAVQVAFLMLRLYSIVEWRWYVVLMPLWIYLALPPLSFVWWVLSEGR